MTANLAVKKYTEVLTEKETIYGIKEVTVKTLSTGNIETYKVSNGTWYNIETPNELIRVLDQAKRSQTRCRFFLGDQETGYDWCEEYDSMGTIGRSMGEIKIPLLIASSRSYGGGALLTSSVVKVVASSGGTLLWKHPSYQKPSFEIKVRGEVEFPSNLPEEYQAAVFRLDKKDGESNCANFRNKQIAEGYVAFMTGERNSKAYGLKVVKK